LASRKPSTPMLSSSGTAWCSCRRCGTSPAGNEVSFAPWLVERALECAFACYSGKIDLVVEPCAEVSRDVSRWPSEHVWSCLCRLVTGWVCVWRGCFLPQIAQPVLKTSCACTLQDSYFCHGFLLGSASVLEITCMPAMADGRWWRTGRAALCAHVGA